MKLGVLVTIISGFGKKGFYQNQEIGLGKALNKLGHEVVVYKCVSQKSASNDVQVNKQLRVKYIPIHAIGVHGYFPVNLLEHDMDGLLMFADNQIFLPHIYRFCEKEHICFVPYIGIAHSAQRNFKSRLMDGIYAIGTRRIYKKIPVLVKTESVKEEMVAQKVTNCTVAPVGLDDSVLKTDYRSSDRRALRKKYGYQDSDVIISFVGRMKPEKRPLDLIDLFDSVKGKKQFKLLMVGEGYQREAVAEKVKAKGLESYVTIIERVPYEHMWEIHYIADYFINLCSREIFGMALLEAVFYGTSVAATKAAGPDAILTGLPGHILCEDDEAIRQWLLRDKPDQSVLDASAKELVRRFSWQFCAKAFVDRVQAYKEKRDASGASGANL